jgi:hypothetical protein
MVNHPLKPVAMNPKPDDRELDAATAADIALASIRIDGGTQPRTAISEETVANYAEHMRGLAAQFPPIVVFFDGVDHWLADGFHRYHAGQQIGRKKLAAIVHEGTRRDAVLFAACANQTHGLQRTNADKRKAVMTLFEDKEWSKWSNHEVARRCGVSHSFVNDVRSSLEADSSEAAPRTYASKHGTVATMKTANIGRARAKPGPDVDIDDAPEPVSFPSRRSVAAPPPRNGIQFARIAIMKLEEIRDNDQERQQAFDMVRRWLDAREAETAMHA